jgi:glucan biosynthesis protein C
MTNEMKKRMRRYEVDWLRVLAVCVLVMIHTAAIFNPFVPFTSVKGKPSYALMAFSLFVHEWRLAILFIVSGAGSYFALKSLSGSRFVLGRCRRLIVPLVMGTLLLVPIHHYYAVYLNNPGYQKTYLQFCAKIIGDFIRYGSFGHGPESLHWAHLWYLAYLFVASVLALPLFLYLRRDRRLIERLADLLSRRWMIFLLALPLVFVEAALTPRWHQTRLIIIDDWANFFFYFTLFVYGFIIYSDERITEAIERHRKSALLFGTLTASAHLIMTYLGQIPVTGYNLHWTLFMVLRGFNAWFWCVAILGFGGRHLRFNHKILPYANEAVYPVYVLHLPVMTMIAYRVVGWNIGVAAQFSLITLFTLAASLCVYEFIIRRTNVTRFLFGLKPKKPARADHPAPRPETIPSQQTSEEAAPSSL